MALTSCNIDGDNFNFEFIPIEEVTIPEEFVLGEIYQIEISYYRPSLCHHFHNFYYVEDINKRTVAVINILYDETNCATLENQLVEKTFDFKAVYNQTYVFKFWQGEDENGEDVFLTYEIPVVE